MRCAMSATRDDTSSLTSSMSEAGNTLVSCQISLDHLGISLNTSTCLLECGGLCHQLGSRDSGRSHRRAEAGAAERFRRTINEPLAFGSHSARDGARGEPTTSDIANAPFWCSPGIGRLTRMGPRARLNFVAMHFRERRPT